MSVVHRTRIKFCGMTGRADIDAAVALGIDAVGLVLVERSPRHVDVTTARSLRERLPPFVAAVALTMDAAADEVARIVREVRPDWLQFHGREIDADCARFDVPYLKALPMADDEAVERMVARHPQAAGFVLDAHASGGIGGSGQRFDWRRIPVDLGRPWLLAGGLDPDNVFDAICALRPYAVDVSSGIERQPGCKCPQRMARFVAEVRRADAAIHAGSL